MKDAVLPSVPEFDQLMEENDAGKMVCERKMEKQKMRGRRGSDRTELHNVKRRRSASLSYHLPSLRVKEHPCHMDGHSQSIQ